MMCLSFIPVFTTFAIQACEEKVFVLLYICTQHKIEKVLNLLAAKADNLASVRAECLC